MQPRCGRFMPILALIVLAMARPGTAPAWADVTQQDIAVETIPWNDLGARAGAQYQGDGLGVSATESGARMRCDFQKIEGQVSPAGLWLISTERSGCEDWFQVIARRTGRAAGEGSSMSSPLLARTGEVAIADRVVRFVRPGLVEEYSASMDGLRQDFVVLKRPPGRGELRVELEVTGAKAEPAAFGARLVLDESRREIAYSRLSVADAHGRTLTARIEVASPTGLAVVVDDADAAYPVRIDPTFSDADWVSMGTLAGADNVVRAMAVGAGGTLYVGGNFVGIGDLPLANRVAKWDGSSWSALGSGVDSPGSQVQALAVSGTDLYVGGFFSTAGGIPANSIAKWDGSTWSALGAGVAFSPASAIVLALAVSGTDLYAGGQFNMAGGFPANFIAKWDGSTWSPLGGGTNTAVSALAVSGTDLYAGGVSIFGGSSVARWNGSAWSVLGAGVNNTVRALAVSGTDLYVGGVFTAAGGSPASRVARWNGSAWSALGSGVNGTVFALAVSGTDLYAGGTFNMAGGFPANFVAKWDGSTWSPLGGGTNSVVFALAVSGTDLYVGGQFTTAGGGPARRIAKWDGGAWSVLGPVADVGLDSPVNAVAVSGTDLYVGGGFVTAGTIPASFVAKWDGSAWSALGAGVNGGVFALAVSGTDLYVAGSFTTAGGSPASNIARWDGSAWSPLGAGINSLVLALAVSGADLYVGGDFSTAGGSPASRVAKWDGSAWSALGTGVSSPSGFVTVLALAVSGTDLFAGGQFTLADGGPANNIARWDGGAWSALGTGVSSPSGSSNVGALAVSGTDLFVGGRFATAGSSPANNIARWDGSAWGPLGSGVNNTVRALAVAGTDLYAVGDLSAAGDEISAFAARGLLAGSVGSVAGQVVADCPAANSPLIGVHVDAFEVGSGDLVGTAVTDAGGGYLIENLPAGSYVVTIVTALGYTTPSVEAPATVVGGQTATANFALHCQAITADPRSIGFWKHQVGVATGGKGHGDIDASTLCSHLDLIAAHFNDNAINQVIVYVPPVSGECGDKLQVAKQLLNLTGSVAMIDRAKQQLMALLLNVAAGYISQTQVISIDGATVSQAITYCDNLIDNPTGDHEKAKTIADRINNGQPVPAGMVPVGTQVIPYHLSPTAGGAATLSLGGVHPNPARGAFTVDFALAGHGPAWLEVIDVAGRRLLRQEVGRLGAGRHSLVAADGISLAPGVYTLRLSEAGRLVSCSVVVLR